MILLVPLISEAQLSAPGMSTVRYTSYPSAPTVKDPVFIYCNDSGSQKGTLNASNPGGTGPFDFSWYKWSNTTKSFSILLKTETGVLTSSSGEVDEGGYKVILSGSIDTSFVGWIFIDKPFASAALQNFTCDYVALKGLVAVDTFYYNNISNGIPVKLPDGVRFLWSSDPSSTIPYPDFLLNPQTFDPPLVDVTYKLQITDSFGCMSESSFFYQTIRVKADFTANPDNGDAPLGVTFTNNSVRASSYKWDFGDKDSTNSTLSDPGEHIYYKPGEYSVKLTVQNNVSFCIDSLRLDKNIVVNKSELNIPNVFTPNGDGINDNFIVESKSLRTLSMEVFSRSGLKVYSFFGDAEKLKNWKGWDGNINSSSAKATPGVYYYLIKAYGWDDVNYDGKEYRGFVYLYR